MARLLRLAGKRAVVTGGANGIGAGIVEAFVREGARVFFTSRSDEEASRDLQTKISALDLAKDLGGENASSDENEAKTEFALLDNADFESVQSLLDSSIKFLGSIDILVNNAATMSRTLFLDLSREEYERIMDVNLRFPFFATQSFAKHMISKGKGGSIINISSVSSYRAVSKMAHYQSSKAGLSMLTKSAAYELGEHSIRVNTISPGLTATKANRNQWEGDPELWAQRSGGIPLGRPGIAQDHASAAVFLASDESVWMSGGDLVIDGGWAAG